MAIDGDCNEENWKFPKKKKKIMECIGSEEKCDLVKVVNSLTTQKSRPKMRYSLLDGNENIAAKIWFHIPSVSRT